MKNLQDLIFQQQQKLLFVEMEEEFKEEHLIIQDKIFQKCLTFNIWIKRMKNNFAGKLVGDLLQEVQVL